VTPQATHARLAWIGALDYTTETLTAGNATVVVNTLHNLDISGLTAARDFVLPATAAVGDRVAVRCSTDAPTTAAYVLQIKNAAGDTIDGTDRSSTIRTALFIKGEVMVFRCVTANSAWVTEYDGRTACAMVLKLTTSESGTKNSATFYAPTALSGAWTAERNVGACGDTATGRFNVRRAGQYSIYGDAICTTTIADANYWNVRVGDGTSIYVNQQVINGASGTPQICYSGGGNCAAGSYLEFTNRGQEASKYVSNVATYFCVNEVLP
jgi:hypothetical protein